VVVPCGFPQPNSVCAILRVRLICTLGGLLKLFCVRYSHLFLGTRSTVLIKLQRLKSC
jgi:hypothetical protein